MNNFDLPEHISDKIYEVKLDENENIAKLVSYFPLSNNEKKEIQILLGDKFSHGKFLSIFSDQISDEEWKKSKEQIKAKFQKELLGIDKK